MREHRIAHATTLIAGRNVKLIHLVVVEGQQGDDSAGILGDPGLALRNHLMDHEGAYLGVSADGRQVCGGAAPRGDIHRRYIGRVGGIRASEGNSHQCRSPPDGGALSRIGGDET
jgi:hypothetical protein